MNDFTNDMALDDARRVKVLSPGAMVVKRFFASKLSIVGLSMLIFILFFSFLGGALMPYSESTVFYTTEQIVKDYIYATYNTSMRITSAPEQPIPVLAQGQVLSAIQQGKTTAVSGGMTYTLEALGEAWLISVQLPKTTTVREAGLATKLIISSLESGWVIDYETQRAFEQAIVFGEESFETGLGEYRIAFDDGSYYVSSTVDGAEKFVASTLSIQPASPDVIIPLALRKAIEEAIAGTNVHKSGAFTLDGINYKVKFASDMYTIQTEQTTQLISVYERPSTRHWLGTDGNGMDVMTRLMYGGRVSLLFALAVILIDFFIGTILGGISGYFGGWVDMLIMRLVDIWYCIPTMPLYIIIGAVMDGLNVDPAIRISALVMILGFMSWAGTARLVRGQILSLREQEFMVAADALGLKTSRRIFRHLIPNVIPQMIVSSTMGVGSVILTEATLSFLGLGIKYPMASWGTILNMAQDTYVMTNYPAVWIPAGLAILLTVLAFNFVGDGLRDAFDPRTKR
jgi:peptide/nickel transport system permease protein